MSVSQELGKQIQGRYGQEALYEMVGQVWHGQEYIFGIPSSVLETIDIGFHCLPENGHSSKTWPIESWMQLEELLQRDYSISWQDDFRTLEEYFNWMQRCRLVVTQDDFGLHLAIAMKKKIVAIFSSTDSLQVYLYGRGTIVTARNCLCSEVPCNQPQCRLSEQHCYPEVHDIDRAVRRLFDPVDPAAQLAGRLTDLAGRQQKSLDEIRRYASVDGLSFTALHKEFQQDTAVRFRNGY
jgi:heptosyltransferase-2